MTQIVKYQLFTFILFSIFFFCCHKPDHSYEGDGVINKPPIAVAGPDQVITLPTDSVTLDGSASNDPDGMISSYLWTKISGSASINISIASISKTIVNNLVAGVYQFELKVKDDKGLFSKDTIKVTVNSGTPANRSPVANAGADQTISLPTNSVILSGNGSTDPDNNIINYLWTKISGPSLFNITNADAVQTQVSNLVEGIYQFELKVSDAGGLFSKDTMQVTVMQTPANLPPCFIENPPVTQAALTQIGTLSVPRMPIAATAGNKVVFAGGWSGFTCSGNGWRPTLTSRVVDIYDISTNSWSTAQLSMPRAGIRSISLGNKIFFAGGENGFTTVYDNVDIYDISTNTWTTAHLSAPRAYVTTAAIGNKVFFAGGYYYDMNSPQATPNGVSNIVDIYDVSTDQWSVATLSSTATDLYTATAANGKVYFAGGNNDGIIHIYDNSTNLWSTSSLQFQWRPNIYFPVSQNPVTSFAIGDDIYWAGIVDEHMTDPSGDDVYTGRAEVRNTQNNTTTIKCFPLFYSQHAVFKNNEIAFFSSYRKQSWTAWGVNNFFTIYNTTTGTWSTGNANLSFFTINHDAGIVNSNNTIYVGGGSYPGSCVTLLDKVYILSW